MSSKQLSIIIPCYNCADTLKEAVDSCYTQGFEESEFDIVMVDDCSSDKTREVMKELAQEHTNIQCLFHSENKGGGAARNTAVRNTESEIIFCLDSDDILPQNTLSLMYRYLKEKNCDGVCIHYSIKFNGNDVTDIDHVDTLPYAGEKIPFESVFQFHGVCPVYLVFMFTRTSFESSGGYPTDHGFDTQGFGWRFLAAGNSAYTCPESRYLHRINSGDSYYIREYKQGKINHNWRMILFEHIDIFEDSARDLLEKFDYSDFTRDVFEELKKTKPLLKPNYHNFLSTKNLPKNTAPEVKVVNRDSLKGILMRIRRMLLS
jgi:glycosyltransferase involved in cell wall biosynthesis